MNKTWKQFIDYGSGFEIEGQRDYKAKGEPLIYHLKMFGLIYSKHYELVGKNLNRLLNQAIKDGQKFHKEINK